MEQKDSELELGAAIGEECLRIIVVKNKRLFAVLLAFVGITYALMTCVGKSVEYILTDEQMSPRIFKVLDAFVNKTVTKLTERDIICH